MPYEVYALIKVASGTHKNVIKKLKAINEVKEIYQVSGIYDIIATIQSTGPKELNEIIEKKVRSIEEINSIISCVVINC